MSSILDSTSIQYIKGYNYEVLISVRFCCGICILFTRPSGPWR